MTALRMVDAVTGVELWVGSMGNKGFKQAKRYMEDVGRIHPLMHGLPAPFYWPLRLYHLA